MGTGLEERFEGGVRYQSLGGELDVPVVVLGSAVSEHNTNDSDVRD